MTSREMGLSFRPPAVPLVTTDPYLSCWSMTDCLHGDWPRHWTGSPHSMFGVVRVDGRPYKFMGGATYFRQTAHQTRVEVRPTQTLYAFECGGVELGVTFTSPLLQDDLDLLSRPITYVSFDVRSLDGLTHEVSVYFDISAEWAVTDGHQDVLWERVEHAALDLLTVRSREQRILGRKGDDLRIDWGTLYLGLPKGQAQSAVGDASATRERFIAEGTLPDADWAAMPRPANSWGGPVLAALYDMGTVGEQPCHVHLLIAYDDEFAIEYFHQPLRAWWRRSPGMTAGTMLAAAEHEYQQVLARCAEFDRGMLAEAESAGGELYARLCALAYRQAVAAHKLVAAPDGRPFFFSKENHSNGCIATVDVTYPSAPLFLIYNPALLKGMMDPIFEYCRSAEWPFPFAAHDLGTYPLANGQVYGDNRLDRQMPVEECGNMLILAAALAQVEGDAEYARTNWDLLTQWAEYLRGHGLDPEKQLCTDDFAGHLAHNVNLSAKAIVALGCYGKLAGMLGHRHAETEYLDIAKAYAAGWEQMADDGDHYRLAFDAPGTWSQKYNLVWDKMLDLNLFPPHVVQREISYYLKMQNRYGLPLDSRRDYTKSDWILWVATMANDRAAFEAFVEPLYLYANETHSRVPLSDWHNTVTGRFQAFKARSVVGGYFMQMLACRLERRAVLATPVNSAQTVDASPPLVIA